MLITPETFIPKGVDIPAELYSNSCCTTLVLSLLLSQQSIADVNGWLDKQQTHLGLEGQSPVTVICCGIAQWAELLAPTTSGEVDKQLNLRRLLSTLRNTLLQQVCAPADSELQEQIKAMHTIRRLSEHFNYGPEWDEVQLLFEHYLSTDMRPTWLTELTVAMRTMYYESTEEAAREVQELLQEVLDSLLSPQLLDFAAMASILTRTNFALPHLMSKEYRHEEGRFTPQDEAFIWNDIINSFLSTVE